MAEEPSTSGTPEKHDALAVTDSTASSNKITPEQREEMASSLVDRFAMWAGVAGLIPVPIVDLIAIGGLQLQMVRRISQIYDVPFAENRGKAIISSLVGSAVPTSSALGAAEVLKALPLIGTAISAFVMPALSAGATYAVGKAFILHFSSGGTLLDFNPPDYREFLKSHKEMWEKRIPKSGNAS
jgi:uncharacterized protein (DUF697 family)